MRCATTHRVCGHGGASSECDASRAAKRMAGCAPGSGQRRSGTMRALARVGRRKRRGGKARDATTQPPPFDTPASAFDAGRGDLRSSLHLVQYAAVPAVPPCLPCRQCLLCRPTRQPFAASMWEACREACSGESVRRVLGRVDDDDEENMAPRGEEPGCVRWHRREGGGSGAEGLR